jgi:hypothetical protein
MPPANRRAKTGPIESGDFPNGGQCSKPMEVRPTRRKDGLLFRQLPAVGLPLPHYYFPILRPTTKLTQPVINAVSTVWDHRLVSTESEASKNPA